MKNNRLPKLSIIFTLLFFSIISTASVGAQNIFRKVNDFDGDGRADYAVTRNTNGQKIWYIWQSTAGFKAVQWGINFDINAAGDYDGDGKTDIAVYREPSNFPPKYTFWVLQSQTNTLFQKEFTDFANFGSFPMQQDYNGDGRTDAAVVLGEFGLNTQMSVSYSGMSGGISTFIPAGNVPIRIGDMDNDGRADKAHYTLNGNLITITNLVTNTSRTIHFGTSNDRYLAADFDGDGTGDLTVWRSSNGTWWWIRSSDNVVNAAQFGSQGDSPVPADYDGDGKTDLAIWRNGNYWILGSQNGISVFNWGISGDTPVSY